VNLIPLKSKKSITSSFLWGLLNLDEIYVQSIEKSVGLLVSGDDLLHRIQDIGNSILLPAICIKGLADPGYQAAFIDGQAKWRQVRIIIPRLMFIKILGQDY